MTDEQVKMAVNRIVEVAAQEELRILTMTFVAYDGRGRVVDVLYGADDALFRHVEIKDN